ncbi:MAG TPA: ABC transporter substrate-binding protein [Beijerinckiaceae bacterium]|nr:ABC transporter substrate-binding protein [Beijerinckiaceae bacterium]
MVNRLRCADGALVTAILVCAFAGAATAQQPAAPPTKLTIMVGVQQGAPSVSVYWVGKAVGFDKEENVDPDILVAPQGNVAQSTQLVIAGKADAALTSIESVIEPAAQGKDPGLVFVYNFFTRPQWNMLVDPASGIHSVADLKGKDIGISALGNPAEPMLGAFLKEGGLSLSDVRVNGVGNAIPAAMALKNGQLAADMAVTMSSVLWGDAGFNFVRLPDPKLFSEIMGAAVLVQRATLADPVKRDAIVRFLRFWAKSQLFVKENPRAAIRLNYQMFPQMKPRNASDDDAIERGMRMQAAMSDSYTTKVDGKWGAFPSTAFPKYAEFLGIADRIPDLPKLWTNDLIDDVNRFDEQAVIAKAQSYK